jgi:hypothetical protein
MRKLGVWRLFGLVALVALIFASQGCAQMGGVGKYFLHRGQDALDIPDVGISVTSTPQWGFYWNSLDFLSLGYSKLDGYVYGWAGGRLGRVRHYNHCYGVFYCTENIGWGPNVDPDDPSTYYHQKAGFVGYILPPYTPFADYYTPAYTPACVHFFPHIGYVGFVWNLRYMEMVDFMLGWVGLDIAGDDGYDVGTWSFPRRKD